MLEIDFTSNISDNERDHVHRVEDDLGQDRQWGEQLDAWEQGQRKVSHPGRDWKKENIGKPLYHGIFHVQAPSDTKSACHRRQAVDDLRSGWTNLNLLKRRYTVCDLPVVCSKALSTTRWPFLARKQCRLLRPHRHLSLKLTRESGSTRWHACKVWPKLCREVGAQPGPESKIQVSRILVKEQEIS